MNSMGYPMRQRYASLEATTTFRYQGFELFQCTNHYWDYTMMWSIDCFTFASLV